MTQADVISKALIDLIQALKGKSNQKGLEQIEALKNSMTYSTTYQSQPKHKMNQQLQRNDE
jgi:hypothetical protein